MGNTSPSIFRQHCIIFLFLLLSRTHLNPVINLTSAFTVSTGKTKTRTTASSSVSSLVTNMFKPTPAVPVTRRFDGYTSRQSSSFRRTDSTTSNGAKSSTAVQNAGHDDQCNLSDDDEGDLHACLLEEGWEYKGGGSENNGNNNDKNNGESDEGSMEEMIAITKIYKAKLESLRSRFPSSDISNRRMHFRIPQRPPVYGANSTDGYHHPESKMNGHHNDSSTSNGDNRETRTTGVTVESHIVQMDYPELLTDQDVVLIDTVRNPKMQSISRAFVRAGPRASLHFNPKKVNAAIVTCGGLCPGLNNVIRELTRTLYYLYGANEVWGIRGGFHGFHDLPEFQPVLLTDEMVRDIHHEGGTILRSSRGGFDIDKIVNFLQEKKIDHLYVIGGDGTHRGAYRIHQECMDRNLNVAVAGIPKTIDNDVDYIDRSFGFLTSVEAAQASIRTAKIEAQSTMPNGCTVVKLMGRSAGFLAAVSALGSGDVDCLLVPEVPIVLDGPNGILPFLYKRIQEQKYAVVVVAEGAGEDLLGQSTEVDRGGNRKLPPIGEYIQNSIKDYFSKLGEESTVRYIDPSYTVRSNPANAVDTVYCTQLAQNAVHGAMAGYTGFSVGLVNNEMVYLPIPQLVATSPRNMNPHGPTWEAVLAMTGQPNHAPSMEEKKTGKAAATSTAARLEESIPRHEIAVP